MPSLKCHHCFKVKRCALVLDASGRLGYVCRACARALGYADTSTGLRRGGKKTEAGR